MNKFINTLALTALMVGAVACSSKPKVEEQTTAPEVAAAPAPAETAAPVETAPAKDLSLGTGSSGRGH